MNTDNTLQTTIDRERAQWKTHLSWFIRRVTSAIPFDVPVIELDKYGLTPAAVYNAPDGRARFVNEIFEDIFEPLVIFQQTLCWTLHQASDVAINRIAFRMATYNRRNRCHLRLKILHLSEIGEIGELFDELDIDCMNIVDNSYFTVPLEKPLPPGKYRCEVHSPDANVENAVALFVAVPQQPVEFREEDSPKPLSLPTTAQYREWYLHHACREEKLAEQRDTVARLTHPVTFFIQLSQPPTGSLQTSLLHQTYPYWQCLSPEPPGNIDERFKSLDVVQPSKNDWVMLLDANVTELEPQALYAIASALRDNQGNLPDLIYTDGVVVDADNNLTHIDFRPDFNPCWYLGYPYIHDLLLCRGISDKTIDDLLLNAVVEQQDVLHISQPLYRAQSAADVLASTRLTNVNTHLQRCYPELSMGEAARDDCLRVRAPIHPGTVSIIIPTRDRSELLQQCIDSITAKTRLSDGVSLEIIVVDNDSAEPETLTYFDKLRAEGHKVIAAPGEFNFSALNNLAAAQASGDYLLFLNNDIEIIDPDWLIAMLEVIALPDAGIIGAKLLYPENGLIQHASDVIGFNGIAHHDHQFFPEKDGEIVNAGHQHALGVVRQCMAVTAACLLMRRKIFELIEGFDENLHVGFGDTDLCLRVQDAGYHCVFTPFARLLHHESASRGRQHADPHPLDSDTFLRKWESIVKDGDRFYNSNLVRSEGDMFAPEIKKR